MENSNEGMKSRIKENHGYMKNKKWQTLTLVIPSLPTGTVQGSPHLLLRPHTTGDLEARPADQNGFKSKI